MRTRFTLCNFYKLLLPCILLLAACSKNDGGSGSGSSTYSGPNGPSSFTSSPIEVSKIKYLLSLGWIQPVGHTIPTDHVYFWYNSSNNSPLPVYALAAAKVEKILLVPLNGIQECKTWFRVNEKFSYYLDHIVLDASIKEGSMVTAGQTIGTTGLSSSIDLGAIDETITLTGYANPARYAGEELTCGKPFQYFTEPLKSQLYALVDREGTDKDGRIDIDIPGKLVGNWFLDGSVFYMDGPDGWDKELSFAFDIQHPSVVLVSIGGTLSMVGKWTIQNGAPLPSQVSVANGKVAYQLYSAGGIAADATQRALMIVQMMDEKHIKVEVFADSKAADAAFDANAKTYAR
jgi:hypothetical protein